MLIDVLNTTELNAFTCRGIGMDISAQLVQANLVLHAQGYLVDHFASSFGDNGCAWHNII